MGYSLVKEFLIFQSCLKQVNYAKENGKTRKPQKKAEISTGRRQEVCEVVLQSFNFFLHRVGRQVWVYNKIALICAFFVVAEKYIIFMEKFYFFSVRCLSARNWAALGPQFWSKICDKFIQFPVNIRCLFRAVTLRHGWIFWNKLLHISDSACYASG